METRAHHVAVGAFVLSMIVLAVAIVLWMARANLTTQYTLYDIFFEGPVTGLRPGATVEYNGVPIGRVTDVRIDPANVEQIRVTVEIDGHVVIKEDAAASVETNILSGVSYIQIVGGTQEAKALEAKPEQRYPVIRAHRSRLASLAARAPQLLDRLIDVADKLDDVLNDKNRRAVAESLDNLRVFSAALAARDKDIAAITQNADKLLASLNTLVGDIDRSYAGEDGLGRRAKSALGDIDQLAKDLIQTDRQLQAVLGDLRPGLRNFGQRTLADIGELVGEARQLISGWTRVADQIQRDPSRILFGDRREGYRPK